MFAAWIVFPLVLGALALGCGLLLEAICRTRLAGTLLAPAGLCVLIVVGGLFTVLDATAELAVPAVVALAVAGLALSTPSRVRQLDWWALAASIGVFGVFAAPVVLSGEATFAGYVRLDDTSHWLAITDSIMDRGRDLSGVPPSGYELNVRSYLETGYPVGSFMPLGIGHVLLDYDSAWLFQPSLAFFAAMMTLALYSLVSRVVESRPLSALIAFVAGQPALLFGWYLLGGVKEIGAACALAVLAALLVYGIERRDRQASLVPAAVACAATVSILSLGGAVWLVIPLLAAGAIMAIAEDPLSLAWRAGIFVGLSFVLSLPALVEAGEFFKASDTLSGAGELGVLFEALNPLQVLGIWPADDIRIDPDSLAITYVLLALLAAGAIAGLVFAWLRRAWGPLLFFAGAAAGCILSAAYGSPWVDSKAFAIASPAFVLLGMLGAVGLARGGPGTLSSYPRARAAGAVVIAVAISLGVVWSNVLAYRGANLAPRDRLAELERIGEQIAGQGPTLMTEPELYGVRYFLRGAEPEGVSIRGRRPVFLRNGQTLPSFVAQGTTVKRGYADIDRLRVQNLLVFRTLVLRRSPVASRPPAAFRLVSQGKFYEVWQRPEPPARATIAHLPLGGGFQPAAVPRCGAVQRLARRARGGGVLAAVRRPPNIVTIPPTVPGDDLTRSATFDAPAPGRYGVWLGGEGFRRQVEVLVDGELVGSASHELSPPDQYHPLGDVELTRGRHRLVLRYGDADLNPGGLGEGKTLGPVVLSRGTAAAPVTVVRPGRATSLCGQRLDWVEALGP